MGVLGGPLGHLWEFLSVPWGHLGSACGALAVLEIIEKPCIFVAFPRMGDPWATLDRLWCVLWGHWALCGDQLGDPQDIMGALGIARGVPRACLGPILLIPRCPRGIPLNYVWAMCPLCVP